MQNLPKFIYTKVFIVCIFINDVDDILIHTLVDDNAISPVRIASTDYRSLTTYTI